MTNTSTVDEKEVQKFAQYSKLWWDLQGPFKTLHDINPTRIHYIEKFQDLKNKTLLDVGCGGGILSEALAHLGAIVTGIDPESEAIRTAKAHAKAADVSVNYLCQTVESCAGPSFDSITCMEMLEHVPKPEFIIEQAARLLKPGGFLFLSTINRNPISYASMILAAEYVLGLLPRQTHDYKKFIKPAELADMVRAAGLEVLDIQGLSYNPITRMSYLQPKPTINYLMACRKA